MSRDPLVEGIRRHLQQGDNPEQIRQHVIEAGYSQEEFITAYTNAQSVSLKEPFSPVRYVIGGSIMFAIVVLGVGIYMLLPYLEGIIADIQPKTTDVEKVLTCDMEPTKEAVELALQLTGIDAEIEAFVKEQTESEYEQTDDIDDLLARWQERDKKQSDLLTRRSKAQSEIVFASLNGKDEMINEIYKQYCVAAQPLVAPSATLDTTSEMFTSFETLYYSNELACKLKEQKYAEGEVHQALYTLGFHLMLVGDFDTAVNFYECAATRYFSPVGMYRVAQLNKFGSDELKQVMKSTTEIRTERDVPIDYKKAYFWTAALHYMINMEKIAYFDISNSMGWSAVAMLDDLQMTRKLSREEMLQSEQEVIDFLVSKYPELASSQQQNSVYNHSMDAIMEALETGQVNIETDGNVTNITVSDDFEPSTRNSAGPATPPTFSYERVSHTPVAGGYYAVYRLTIASGNPINGASVRIKDPSTSRIEIGRSDYAALPPDNPISCIIGNPYSTCSGTFFEGQYDLKVTTSAPDPALDFTF